ncbi:MAG: DDE-type integrase/transposase/recombinase, partial [Thermoplasmata archaeon]
MRIYENIKEKGYNGSYILVKITARKYRNDKQIKAVFRFETGPGEQAQVDFGEYGRIEVDGKFKKLYFFSMILGYSRKRYVEFTTDISTANMINLHMKAFRYFNGYTDSILYDNMKQVVLDRKLSFLASITKFIFLLYTFFISSSEKNPMSIMNIILSIPRSSMLVLK